MKSTFRRLGGLFRFLGLWAGIGGTYAALGNTCPCCGRAGCPVGLSLAVLLGAIGSALINFGRNWLGSLQRWIKKITSPFGTTNS